MYSVTAARSGGSKDFAFGRPEPELRRLEAVFRAAFGWQVALAESTRTALEREHYDMFTY